MVLRDTDVLVHIEGDDVLEGHASGLMSSYQRPVHAQGRGACGEAEDEGLSCAGLSSIDLGDDIVCRPLRDACVVRLDDKTHYLIFISRVSILG